MTWTGAAANGRLRSTAGLVIVLGVWWIVSGTAPQAIPSPSRVVRVLVEETATGGLLVDVGVSLGRALTGFVVGGITGLLVGGVVAQSWWARAALWPLLEVARPVPPLAWIPVAILWLGIDESSKIFVVALGAFFPTLINTYFGIRGLDPAYVRAARTLGAGRIQVFFTVVMRGALPDIFTGLKMGWALGFISLVAAELVASRSGLGYVLTTGRLNDRLDVILAAVVVIGLLGLVVDWVIRRIGRLVLVWNLDLQRMTE